MVSKKFKNSSQKNPYTMCENIYYEFLYECQKTVAKDRTKKESNLKRNKNF